MTKMTILQTTASSESTNRDSRFENDLKHKQRAVAAKLFGMDNKCRPSQTRMGTCREDSPSP